MPRDPVSTLGPSHGTGSSSELGALSDCSNVPICRWPVIAPASGTLTVPTRGARSPPDATGTVPTPVLLTSPISITSTKSKSLLWQ